MSKQKDAQKRQRILQAATKIFASKGYTQAKISEIARESGVADGTIYLYFKNKDDLLLAVFEYNMDFIIPHMRQQLDGLSTPLDQLQRFITTHLQMIGEHRDLSRVFQVDLQKSQEFLGKNQNTKLATYLGMLTEIILTGQKQGYLRSDMHAETIQRVLFGALSDIALQWILSSGEAVDLQESGREVYQILVGGLLPAPQQKYFGAQSLSAA